MVFMCFYTKNTQKVNFSSNYDYNTGHFIDFSPEKGDFSSKYACISSFTTKISKKLIFPQIVPNNTGHFIDFSPKKVIFSSKCACISSTILTFLPNNPVCFYTKNSQKVNFFSNCDYNTGHFIDFSPKKSFFPQNASFACISSTVLTFLTNNPECFYNKLRL